MLFTKKQALALQRTLEGREQTHTAEEMRTNQSSVSRMLVNVMRATRTQTKEELFAWAYKHGVLTLDKERIAAMTKEA